MFELMHLTYFSQKMENLQINQRVNQIHRTIIYAQGL